MKGILTAENKPLQAITQQFTYWYFCYGATFYNKK